MGLGTEETHHDRPFGSKLPMRTFDPDLPFENGSVNGRKARESGHRLKVWIAQERRFPRRLLAVGVHMLVPKFRIVPSPFEHADPLQMQSDEPSCRARGPTRFGHQRG